MFWTLAMTGQHGSHHFRAALQRAVDLPRRAVEDDPHSVALFVQAAELAMRESDSAGWELRREEALPPWLRERSGAGELAERLGAEHKGAAMRLAAALKAAGHRATVARIATGHFVVLALRRGERGDEQLALLPAAGATTAANDGRRLVGGTLLLQRLLESRHMAFWVPATEKDALAICSGRS
jgi:hypothetical protein